MTRIGDSTLDVLPLCLGGNVFGWTADRDTSFAVLDEFHAGGGTFIDTADGYSAWAPGHTGGESEKIIGDWLRSRTPKDVVVATKVGTHPEFRGLSAANIRAAAEASLTRLGVDTIDLYYAHFDDPEVPMAEIVEAFGALVTDGLAQNIAISNMSPERIREWITLAQLTGAARPVAIQPHYNLVHRNEVEESIIPIAEEYGMSLVPYYGLASGFLTGKFRDPKTADETPRGRSSSKYITRQGLKVIDTLERIGNAHDASIATIALAWLRAQPTVAAPIASASRPSQVADLLASTTIDLTPEDISDLDAVSSWTPSAA
ncbi:aryl-alcohol dehydrogenase-like predicted oxidoreductase [Microbacterium endophyticum]|uniref:Aryl-alcohol dehydrogenase-like predicted oxidoreductase n=1 Tax=Microbacterium endophyticum TaxID=1526412 RepID=A0A7W4V326_9MICO|nr:aldo/keto reductase [Microbacterium endophyticum]MBB2975961.1 aryl-alcohol dehydrogenase-like predicted oxidoreductase [Microbacterium endophyticum]NIK37670.1 aryl-alcohol dehydrogenase-like predicted oxidoreductase [Microbacterium endophyticum]